MTTNYTKHTITDNRSAETFIPPSLQTLRALRIDQELLALTGSANRLLGRLDGISESLGEIDMLVTLFIRKESLLSTQISGNISSIEGILDPVIDENKNPQAAAVNNYTISMVHALTKLNHLSISNELFKEIHVVLNGGFRGGQFNSGDFRHIQTWIGYPVRRIQESPFIPPPADMLENLMYALGQYMHVDNGIDPLIKISLIHYQFETIHPFMNGNGRIGRMLITLWFVLHELLKYPVIYMSHYFRLNSAEYFTRLTEARFSDSIEQWIRFFLRAVISAAEDSVRSIYGIIEMKEQDMKRIYSLHGYRDNVIKFYNYTLRNPIIDVSKASADLELQYNTIVKSIEKLSELGIIHQINNKRRNRRFAHSQLLEILKKDV